MQNLLALHDGGEPTNGDHADEGHDGDAEDDPRCRADAPAAAAVAGQTECSGELGHPRGENAGEREVVGELVAPEDPHHAGLPVERGQQQVQEHGDESHPDEQPRELAGCGVGVGAASSCIHEFVGQGSAGNVAVLDIEWHWQRRHRRERRRQKQRERVAVARRR